MTERLLSTRETATRLGVREGTLAAWRARKVAYRPDAVIVGRRVMYRESVIDSWIAAREERRTSK